MIHFPVWGMLVRLKGKYFQTIVLDACHGRQGGIRMKRIRHFDLLRVICFCMVIFYHMMAQVYLDNMFMLETVSPYFENVNMHIATLAVAVFFMLSGASLITSTKDHINYKAFYIKRFLRLLFPFYFVNICWFIIRAVSAKSISAVIGGIAPWKIILGVLGIDGWLELYGISGFGYGQGIGEWFLGCIVILYALFPLFRKLMLKNKIMFLAVVVSIYVIAIYGYSSAVPIHMNIIVKGCEFIFGMYLGMYWSKLDKKLLAVSLPVVVFYFTSKTFLDINNGLKITKFALSFFITFSFMEDILQKSRYFNKFIGFLSGCSYELFLVHHIVIYKLTPIASQYTHNKKNLLILFIIELAVMGVSTFAVKTVCDFCMKHIRQHLHISD